MQNHSSYGTPYDNFTPSIEAKFKNTKSTKYLNNYLSLMKYTDDAINYLLTELSASDKKTIVVLKNSKSVSRFLSLSGQIMISRRKVILHLVPIIFLQKLPRLPVLALQNIKASSHRCQKCFLSSMQLAM